MVARHSNQLTVGRRDRGDVEEKARPSWIAVGGLIPSFGVTKWNNNKNRDKRGLGLRRLPIDNFPHNNQPKIGVRDAGEYEGEERQAEGVGEAQYHCFGGVGS